MTRLLVSVRNAEEALAALEGGADLIDVKEPLHGSLGRASAGVLRNIAQAVGQRSPLSAALGELGQPLDAATMAALKDYHYAKIGLAQAASRVAWRSEWADAVQQLPASVQPVAVVYADGPHCGAPPVEEVLAEAIKHSCAAVLLDTFEKNGNCLFDHWRVEQVAQFVDFARKRKLLSVLAGALNAETMRLAASLNPEFIAVRSAVCEGPRSSPIRVQLVRRISLELAQADV